MAIRISQIVAEATRSPVAKARISQIVAEATRSPVAKARISQIVAEASIKVATSVLPTVQVVIID